jgi:N-acetylglucosamine-6-phosphate deacetylase
MVVRGKIVGTDSPVSVEIQDAKIAAIEDGAAPPGSLGGEDVWISPTFFDIQVNGALGINYGYGDLTPEKIDQTLEPVFRSGTGLFCPTVTTSPAPQATAALRTLAVACEESETVGASFVAFHVEGPYISSEDGPKGAHPPDHIRDPDWDEFCRYQDAAGGRIRIFTLAPEREGSLPFIEKLVESGVIVALGHTGASRERIREAVAAGARLSTHLGNGTYAMIPRHENNLWEQLATDDLWASLIADGHHLPPPVLKSFCRAKGVDRVCLVSDVSSIAGLPPGTYDRSYSTDNVEIHPDGKISLAGTPYLAGSTLFLDRGIANTIAVTDATLADAVQMATANPARLLGVDERVGAVEVGREASLTLFRWQEGVPSLSTVATIVRGEVVYRAS